MDVRHAEPWTGVSRYALPMPSLSRVPALILIVEDEALVRALGVGIFLDAGFRVIEAVNSDEALEFLEAESEVQLLFTDVNMPGTIDGLALARQARDRWPHIGVIVVSGQVMPKPQELPAGCHFHRKPYDPNTVVRQARELTAA
jgi:two-component system, response regulator PdtaR